MRIAVHSDLHTEVSFCTLEGLADADLLVLAGDIGDSQTLPIFLDKLRRDMPTLPTIYVMGNHEFYGHEFFQAKQLYRDICERFSVRMLDNEAVWFNDILIAGSILWSDFMLAGEAQLSMSWAQRVLPDFKYIRYQKALFSAHDMVYEHQQAVAFLEQVLNKKAAYKLVVSHFLPSRLLVDPKHCKNHEGLIRSAYWTTHLPALYAKADAWIYGHSHSNIEKKDGGCYFISNQRGYSHELNGHERNGYQQDYQFSLDLVC